MDTKRKNEIHKSILHLGNAYNEILRLNHERDEIIAQCQEEAEKYISSLEDILEDNEELPIRDKCQVQNFVGMFESLNAKFNKQVIDSNRLVELYVLPNVLEDRICTAIVINHGHIDVVDFLNKTVELMLTKLDFTASKRFKVNLVLACKYENLSGDKMKEEVRYFSPQPVTVHDDNHKDKLFGEQANQLQLAIEQFNSIGPAFRFKEIINLSINVKRIDAPNNRESTYVPLPYKIQKKGAVVNIRNEDERCFVWSVLAALYSTGPHPERIHFYKHHEKNLILDGINFPTTLNDVKHFEILNDLSINVYGLDDDCKVVPLYLSRRRITHKKRIHLLMVESRTEKNKNNEYYSIYHFCWIKNLSRLVRHQYTKNTRKKIFCERCLKHFLDEKAFRNVNHQVHCLAKYEDVTAEIQIICEIPESGERAQVGDENIEDQKMLSN